MMRVVRARIQTVEEIHRLVWTAVANKKPIEATYQGRPRLFCPHRLGRNRIGQLRVLCYQYDGESRSGLQSVGSPANWRCVALDKTQPGEVSARRLAHGKSFPPCLLRDRDRYRRRGSSPARSTKRDIEELPQELSGKNHSQGRNGIGIMSLGANAVTHAGGSPAPVRGQRI